MWFKKHLNWAYVISFAGMLVACFIMGLIVGLTSPNYSENTVTLLSYLIAFVVMFPISLIILKAKNRSLWWIFLAGWFSPLWLGSKLRHVNVAKTWAVGGSGEWKDNADHWATTSKPETEIKELEDK